MRTADLGANESAEFILSQIPTPHARILDVGCGEGLVASLLQAHGHKIVAIDESPESVQQARARGIDARVATWPAYEDSPFGAVLFVRSLHHIHPLAEAVKKAHQLLVPSGQVIVEEFAWTEIDPVTAEWFYGVVRLLDRCQVLVPSENSFAIELAQSSGEFSFWQQSHDPDLNTVSQILSALQTRFQLLSEASLPYLYRYLCPVVVENEAGIAIVSQVHEMEKRLAQLGAITFIGRRFVGAKI